MSARPCDLVAGTRVVIRTRTGATLAGEVRSDYRAGWGVDFQPDVGNAIYLPATRIRDVRPLRSAPRMQQPWHRPDTGFSPTAP
jgi:hypothetical protein